jgi:hypothetical protein
VGHLGANLLILLKLKSGFMGHILPYFIDEKRQNALPAAGTTFIAFKLL